MTTRHPNPSRWLQSPEPWLALVFVANAGALLLRAAARCFGSDIRTLASTIQDDSFYYLLPAFRFHEAGFFTFDGENPTFGVQPIYAAFITALAGFHDDRFGLFRTALFASFLCWVLTAAILGLVVRSIAIGAGRTPAAIAGVVAAHVYLLNGQALLGHTTLKENSLYALLLALSLAFAVSARRRGSRAGFVALGLVTGLAVSTRITPAQFAVAGTIVCWAAATRWRRGLPAALGGVALAVLPWAVYAWTAFGRVLPTSGSVKTAPLERALHDGTVWTYVSGAIPEIGPWVWNALRYSVGIEGRFGLPQQPLEGLPPVHPLSWAAIGLIGIAVLAWCRPRRLLDRLPEAGLLGLTVVATLLGTASVPVLLAEPARSGLLYYASWYVSDLPVLVAVLAGSGVAVALGRRRVPAWWLRCAAFGVAGALLVGQFATPRLPVLEPLGSAPHSHQRQAIALIDHANEHLEKGSRIASSNAGVFGFFSEHTLVNVDGLANDAIVAARRGGVSLFDYLRQNRIGYFIDRLWPKGWFATNAFDRLDPIASLPAVGDDFERWFLFRVTDERFPDYEPELRAPGVRLEPYREPSPWGDDSAWRNVRFDPEPGRVARMVFHPGGRFGEFRARVGGTEVDTLVVMADAVEVLRVPSRRAPQSIRLALRGVNTLELVVERREGGRGEFWVTDMDFDVESDLPTSPMPDTPTAYGAGYPGDGTAVELRTQSEPAAGSPLTLIVTGPDTDLPCRLFVGVDQDSRRTDTGARVLVREPFVDVSMSRTAAGRWSATFPIPASMAGQVVHLQAVITATNSASIVAASSGLRVPIASR